MGPLDIRVVARPNVRAIGLVALMGALAGCSRSLGVVGVVQPDAEGLAVKMLRPGVEARVCESSVLGFATATSSPTIARAAARMLALDPEADVVMNAEVLWETFVSGLYDRRCVVVRGDVARRIPVVRLPGGASHVGHH